MAIQIETKIMKFKFTGKQHDNFTEIDSVVDEVTALVKFDAVEIYGDDYDTEIRFRHGQYGVSVLIRPSASKEAITDIIVRNVTNMVGKTLRKL